MKITVGAALFLLGFGPICWGQTNSTMSTGGAGETAPLLSANTYAVFGATPQQEALVRSQIHIMQPAVLPLRVFFVAHSKYVDNTRIFHLQVPAGYTSAMFTHLPSRTIFIDADRYINDESLVYWLAHELGHLASNSAKEQDAERAARELRKRLRDEGKRRRHEVAGEQAKRFPPSAAQFFASFASTGNL